ncbi:hypothetical protein ASD77_04045 [Pseudoxanthomonas sp. Root65]|uniref:DUF4124 domain-containing protein n=1 Tax=Pseudoxanthomonas sp. Root65 TaxID=1736576 RepID=UPI0006FE9AD6|nr:DUF4124 domain-containing protein [Pseudoxanthomonas sp. Root65]KRA53825.1 hypothetical protein ASD77_04045 [Pseudoxanthomonas sp. Root65]
MSMKSVVRSLAVLSMLGLSWHAGIPAARAEVVIYRCTDASGALTLQNAPCPKGMKQEQRTMQGINTVPMAPGQAGTATPNAAPAAAAATTPAPATTAPTPPAADAVPPSSDARRLPPPVLFQCTTHDKDSYVTEDPIPASRCVTLRTVGLDGNPQSGAGQACEVVRDTCARVPDGALCDAWKKRRDETEVAARFARPENAEKNRADFERVARIVAESTCGA